MTRALYERSMVHTSSIKEILSPLTLTVGHPYPTPLLQLKKKNFYFNFPVNKVDNATLTSYADLVFFLPTAPQLTFPQVCSKGGSVVN